MSQPRKSEPAACMLGISPAAQALRGSRNRLNQAAADVLQIGCQLTRLDDASSRLRSIAGGAVVLDLERRTDQLLPGLLLLVVELGVDLGERLLADVRPSSSSLPSRSSWNRWKISRISARDSVTIVWISVFWASVRFSFLATSGSLKAIAPRVLVGDLLEPGDLLGLEELADRLEVDAFISLVDLLHLVRRSSCSRSLQLLRTARHLLAVLLGELLGLFDLLVVELELLLDALVADQHRQMPPPPICRSRRRPARRPGRRAARPAQIRPIRRIIVLIVANSWVLKWMRMRNPRGIQA